VFGKGRLPSFDHPNLRIRDTRTCHNYWANPDIRCKARRVPGRRRFFDAHDNTTLSDVVPGLAVSPNFSPINKRPNARCYDTNPCQGLCTQSMLLTAHPSRPSSGTTSLAFAVSEKRVGRCIKLPCLAGRSSRVSLASRLLDIRQCTGFQVLVKVYVNLSCQTCSCTLTVFLRRTLQQQEATCHPLQKQAGPFVRVHR